MEKNTFSGREGKTSLITLMLALADCVSFSTPRITVFALASTVVALAVTKIVVKLNHELCH